MRKETWWRVGWVDCLLVSNVIMLIRCQSSVLIIFSCFRAGAFRADAVEAGGRGGVGQVEVSV